MTNSILTKLNQAKAQSANLDERRQARYAMLTNEQKEQEFLDKVRGLEHHTVNTKACITSYSWKCDKDGAPILGGKPGRTQRLQFNDLTLQFMWYTEDDKPQVRTITYGPNSTGCLFSLIVNTIVNFSGESDPAVISDMRRSLWNLTTFCYGDKDKKGKKTIAGAVEDSDIVTLTADDLIDMFNDLQNEETLQLDTYCDPGTTNVVRTRFNFTF